MGISRLKTVVMQLLLLALLLLSLNCYSDDKDGIIPTLRVGSTGLYSAVFVFQAYQQEVHQLFDDKQYQKAFDGYLRLAMANDKVAQYRLGYMLLEGLGTETDLVRAYAWARLAKENLPDDYDANQKVYQTLHKHIRDKLSDEQLNLAKQKANQYLSKYGNFATSIKARRSFYRERSRCVGSRAGACNKAIQTNDSAGTGICELRFGIPPNNLCLLYGSLGVPSISGQGYQQVVQSIDMVERRIETYNPGRVELRELEIDDSPVTETERS